MPRVGKRFFRTRIVMNYGRPSPLPLPILLPPLSRRFPSLAFPRMMMIRAPPSVAIISPPEMRLAKTLSHRARGVHRAIGSG